MAQYALADEAKRRLKQAGYVQLSEREDWVLESGKKYFFTRNQSTIIAFAIGKRCVCLFIVATLYQIKSGHLVMMYYHKTQMLYMSYTFKMPFGLTDMLPVMGFISSERIQIALASN